MAIAPATQIAHATSDDRLAHLAACGSDAALAEIFVRHQEPLRRYCRSIVGNEHDAADALQNTMLRALRALRGHTRDIALRPWLYRIAHNEAITVLRARHDDADLAQAESIADDRAASLVESRERLRELAVDLAILSEQQRSALLMRELGGLDCEEIGAALGVTAAAAKQSLYEARKALDAVRTGGSMDCATVRSTLASGDRRRLRGLRIRGHLRSCAHCNALWAAAHGAPLHVVSIGPAALFGGLAAWLRRLLPGAADTSAATATATTAGTAGALSGGLAAMIATVAALAGGAAAVDRARDGAAPVPPLAPAMAVDVTKPPAGGSGAPVVRYSPTSRTAASGSSRAPTPGHAPSTLPMHPVPGHPAPAPPPDTAGAPPAARSQGGRTRQPARSRRGRAPTARSAAAHGASRRSHRPVAGERAGAAKRDDARGSEAAANRSHGRGAPPPAGAAPVTPEPGRPDVPSGPPPRAQPPAPANPVASTPDGSPHAPQADTPRGKSTSPPADHRMP